MLARRRHVLGGNLSVSFEQSHGGISIFSGQGAEIMLLSGERVVDGVGNIMHVGHCNAHVNQAMLKQADAFNGNSRYLHSSLVDYAERLAALFPPKLQVVYFTTSGSEANDLALRMARAKTNSRGILALRYGYHGHTSALIEISEYKYGGPGGHCDVNGGGAAHVRVAERETSDAELRIAELRDSEFGMAAFVHETIAGCAGQVEAPPGFLKQAYAAVRAAGGITIADEVQTGFGRTGDLWSFQIHGVTPDIVTLGKSIGNGYPMGAVVTTRDVADAFDNGMEFFASCAATPVAAAVGSAVLDVLEQQRLIPRARRLGDALLAALRLVQSRRPRRVADVRGRGLFLGLELVFPNNNNNNNNDDDNDDDNNNNNNNNDDNNNNNKNDDDVKDDDKDEMSKTKAKADGAAASRVAARVLDLGVQISTDGPEHNVLKIKPPMVITVRQCAQLVAAVARAVLELDVERLDEDDEAVVAAAAALVLKEKDEEDEEEEE